MNNLATVSKALAGALVSAVVALAARYGLHTAPEVVDALGVLVTALVGAGLGFLGVYVAPKNK